MILSTIPSKVFLHPGNTTDLSIQGLQDENSGAFLNAAQVTATLFDFQNNPDPVLQNIAMNYVPSSNGNYTGVVPASFNAALGSGYTLQITASQGGVQAIWSLEAFVTLRTKS